MASRYRTKSFELGRMPASDLEPPEGDLVRTAQEIKASLREDFPFMTDKAFDVSFNKIIAKGMIPDPERYLRNYHIHHAASPLPYEEFKKLFKGFGGTRVIERGTPPEWEAKGWGSDLRTSVTNFMKDERGSVGPEPPKGALTPEQIEIARAKAAFAEKERIAKLAAPKELEELEVLDELTPQAPTGRRLYMPIAPERKDKYEELFGPYPDREYYKKMTPEAHAQFKENKKFVANLFEKEKIKTDLERYDSQMQGTARWKAENPEKVKEIQATSMKKRLIKEPNYWENKYAKLKAEGKIAPEQELAKAKRHAETMAKVEEALPNWREIHAKDFPFVSEEAFIDMARKNIAKGVPLNPKTFAKNLFAGRKFPIKQESMADWLKKYKGFGGDKIIKLDDKTTKLPKSKLGMLPWVNPALLAARGEYGEAAFEGGLNLLKMNPATMIINEMFNAEKLGPVEGSEDYYIEHPWARPKKKGVLDLENKLM